MKRPPFSGSYPLDGLFWSAELRITNTPVERYQAPRLLFTVADPAASFPTQKIELWERPLRMHPNTFYEVCFGLQSVTTLFAMQLQQAKRL